MIIYILIFLTTLPALFSTPPHLFRDGVPRFKTFERQSHEELLGNKVKLSCYALSQSEAVVTWFRNGELIEPRKLKSNRIRDSQKHMTLEIRKLEVSDQGLWTCRVANQVGSIERNFTIEIIDFCQYFQNLGITQTGIPIKCLCEWHSMNIEMNGIDRAQVNDAVCSKYFSMNPKNKKISRSHPTNNEPVRQHPRYLVHDVSTTTIISPRSTSDSAPINESKPYVDVVWDTPNEGSDDDEIIEIPDDKPSDEDSFFTKFSVPPGDIEKAQFTRKPLTEHPYFKDADEHQRDVVSPAGRTVRLSCKAGGYPEPMVIWYKNDALIIPDSPRGAEAEYRIRKWILEMEDATQEDSGRFVCEVWSEIGSVNRTFIVQIVNRMRSPPIIVPNLLVNQTLNVNSTAQFRCKVISDLVPNITWARLLPVREDRNRMPQSNQPKKYEYVAIPDKNKRIGIRLENDESILTIYEISREDEGLYACVTGNIFGITTANATLVVKDFVDVEVPPLPVDSGIDYWWMVFLVFVIVSISILLGLCVAYFTCITYYKKKHLLENEALIVKRKKIIVTHKTHSNEDWGDQPASYHVQVVEQTPPKRKGARFRLSSELTMLDEYEVSTDQNWEIERERLQLLEVIGSGAFGEVWKATLKMKTENGESYETPVAVKKVKPSATEKDLVTLVQEMEMFKLIGCHENILRLIGCCSGVGPLYVLLELCEYGNLRDFLRAHRPKEEKPKAGAYADYLEPRKACYTQKPVIDNLTQRHLVQFAYQIAKAMEFMASRKIVHRDLAARNVLVASNFIMKVSDFGLSKDVKYNDYYRKKGKERLPFKWMAIETLDNQISTIESDVWSFGIVMWEVMTLGGTPYPTIAMEQLFTCLKAGYRMEAPHNCPEEIYVLMVTCWQEKRDLRPTFTMIASYLEWMLQQSPQDNEEALDENESRQENPSYVNIYSSDTLHSSLTQSTV